MKLHFNTIGEGEPIVITHGVFGSGDNLVTASKAIADKGYKVYLVDARNHGRSPHTATMNYEAMAADFDEFLTDQNLTEPVIAGHSMGGKMILEYSQNYDNFSKMVVIDIAPRHYIPHHEHILNGLRAIDLNVVKSRKEAEEIFSTYVSDPGERLFILKNMYRTEEGFAWRINVEAIAENIENIGAAIPLKRKVSKPALFIAGSESNYVQESDEETIRGFYENSYVVHIKGANHWVHASKPKEFVETFSKFLTL